MKIINSIPLKILRDPSFRHFPNISINKHSFTSSLRYMPRPSKHQVRGQKGAESRWRSKPIDLDAARLEVCKLWNNVFSFVICQVSRVSHSQIHVPGKPLYQQRVVNSMGYTALLQNDAGWFCQIVMLPVFLSSSYVCASKVLTKRESRIYNV